MTRHALVALIALAGCDGLPDKPDEASYRALDDTGRCKATAPRAIRCTDELILMDLKAVAGDDPALLDGIADKLHEDKPLPRQERKQNITVHKTSCVGTPGYMDAVFACWSIEDCKKFADCVASKLR